MPPLWLQRNNLHSNDVSMCTVGPWYTCLYLPIMKEPNHFKLNPFNLSSHAIPLGCSTDLSLTHTHKQRKGNERVEKRRRTLTTNMAHTTKGTGSQCHIHTHMYPLCQRKLKKKKEELQQFIYLLLSICIVPEKLKILKGPGQCAKERHRLRRKDVVWNGKNARRASCCAFLTIGARGPVVLAVLRW